MPAPKSKTSLKANRVRLGLLAKENKEAAAILLTMKVEREENICEMERLHAINQSQLVEIERVNGTVASSREHEGSAVLWLWP